MAVKSDDRKRGALSKEERDFIVNNHAALSLDEMCEGLNRNKEPILRYMQENNLHHIEMSLSEEDRRRIKVKKIVEKRYWYKSIESQLISDSSFNEMDIFVNKWVDMYCQFKEDVLPLEESQMNELILLSINLERVRRQEANNIKKINELEFKIEREYSRPEPARDLPALSRWEMELDLARGSSASYINQIKIINHDVQDLHKSLKGTRDQRFNKVESGTKTFTGLIQLLQNDKKREHMEREAELMRMAAAREYNNLGDYHQYIDKEVDLPILNSENLEKLKDKGD